MASPGTWRSCWLFTAGKLKTDSLTKNIKMKNLIKHGSFRYVFMMLLLTFTQAIAWAQDTAASSSSTTTTTSTTTTEQHEWYTQPWVWVAGGAVLLLLIIVLVRGNSSSTTSKTTDRVTIIKKDTESV